MRQHRRRLPRRTAQRAWVAGIANRLHKPAVEIVLQLVEVLGGVEQALARSAGLLGQVVLAEEPRIGVRDDVLRRERFTGLERIVPGLLQVFLGAILCAGGRR